MRLYNLYVVLDKKARTLIGPVVHDHSPVPIIRQITEAVNSEKPGLIRNSPEDFVILHVGAIDDETGQLYTADEDAQQLVPIGDRPTEIAQAIALREKHQ